MWVEKTTIYPPSKDDDDIEGGLLSKRAGRGREERIICLSFLLFPKFFPIPINQRIFTFTVEQKKIYILSPKMTRRSFMWLGLFVCFILNILFCNNFAEAKDCGPNPLDAVKSIVKISEPDTNFRKF